MGASPWGHNFFLAENTTEATWHLVCVCVCVCIYSFQPLKNVKTFPSLCVCIYSFQPLKNVKTFPSLCKSAGLDRWLILFQPVL